MLKAMVEGKDSHRIGQLMSYAMKMDEPELMIQLLALGADLNRSVSSSDQKGLDQLTPIGWAISKGYLELTRQLLISAPDKTRDSLGKLYFEDAITPFKQCPNALDMVALLVEQGADINAKNAFGETVLHQCTKGYNGDERVLEKLIDLRADVNARDAHQNTPLHYAKSSNFVYALLLNDADVNAQNDRGQTPLHQCSDGLEDLIRRGGDVKAQDGDLNTPLHFARNADQVRLLLDAGAAINAENKEGITPLKLASSDAVRRALISRGANTRIEPTLKDKISDYKQGVQDARTVAESTMAFKKT